uniref:Conotoxin n=1 Tax=Conus betulinus TaxID=89764 RepID=A0A142C1H4_CONBE|nr:conotoxin [Conus betulinus]
MSKVEVVLLIFLGLLSLAALQNGDDSSRRQRDGKQSPQRDIVRRTRRRYNDNIQRRCVNSTPCSECTNEGKICSVKPGGKGTCGECVQARR